LVVLEIEPGKHSFLSHAPSPSKEQAFLLLKRQSKFQLRKNETRKLQNKAVK
jgi:hypothetical protein